MGAPNSIRASESISHIDRQWNCGKTLQTESLHWKRRTPRIAMWSTKVVKGSSHVLSCLIDHSFARAVFLMLLLSWDVYTCPQPLAVASACLGRTALIQMLVLLLWCTLSFHSQAVQHLAVDGGMSETGRPSYQGPSPIRQRQGMNMGKSPPLRASWWGFSVCI